MDFVFGKRSEMNTLLKKCKILPKWVKKEIDDTWNCIRDHNNTGYLNLSGLYTHEKINDDMIPQLLQCLEVLGDKVMILDLQQNIITSKGATQLFNGLKCMKSQIQTINLDLNMVCDKCTYSLGEYIKHNSFIETVNITNSLQFQSNNITDAGVLILEPFLIGNETFKHLDLHGNKGISDLARDLLLVKQACV